MGSATYLQGLLADVLAVAEDALAQARTGSPPPAIATISHGPPVIDACSGSGKLAVYLDTIEPRYMAQAGAMPAGRCAVAPVARIIIELWRCVPVPNELGYPPLEADERAAAEDLAVDAWCLFVGVLQEALAGSIVPGSQCDTIALEPIEVLEPQGGAGGLRLPLLVQLDDSGPPLTS